MLSKSTEEDTPHQVLQPHQYATLGKKITDATTSFRDLYNFCVSKKLDAYFISLDFQKAFDSVSHEWLQNVMRTIGFPAHFLTICWSMAS